MIKIACHQPNFIPNYGFFYKMAMVDKFVLLRHVQFEKNNYQNRYYLNTKDKWVTKSVLHGIVNISDKQYADGRQLSYTNYLWIRAIKETLGIDTEIVFDYPTELRGTARIIDLLKHYGGDVYVTSESAKDKYLDESAILRERIGIEYCKVPQNLQKHTFEIFEEFGIDGAIKQLPKRELCESLS